MNNVIFKSSSTLFMINFSSFFIKFIFFINAQKESFFDIEFANNEKKNDMNSP